MWSLITVKTAVSRQLRALERKRLSRLCELYSIKGLPNLAFSCARPRLWDTFRCSFCFLVDPRFYKWFENIRFRIYMRLRRNNHFDAVCWEKTRLVLLNNPLFGIIYLLCDIHLFQSI